MGDQRNGEAASQRGGGDNHGQVVTVSIMMMLLCGVCLCVLFALGFVAGLNSNSSSLHLILY